MQTGFLDANILIGFFKGDAAVKRALERFMYLKIPAAAYVEFMTGLPQDAQRKAADDVIDSLFERIHTTDEICKVAAQLRRDQRLKTPDALIYATAKVGGGTLITYDKDFDARFEDVYCPV